MPQAPTPQSKKKTKMPQTKTQKHLAKFKQPESVLQDDYFSNSPQEATKFEESKEMIGTVNQKVNQALMQNSHNGAFIGMTGTFDAGNPSKKTENDIVQTQAIAPNQKTTKQ